MNPRHRQKPRVGTQINWGHPLAKGLATCLIFQGVRPIDLVTKNGFTVYYGTDTPDGTNFTSANASTIPFKPIAGDLSINFSARIPSFSSINGIAEIPGLTSGYRYYCWIDSSGRLTFTIPGEADVQSSSSFVPAARFVSAGVSYKKQISATFRSGGRSEVVNNTSAPSDTSATSMQVGIIIGAYQLNGMLSYLYVHSRALSTDESLWLNAEPYCFMQPPMPYRRWFVPYVAAGGIIVSPSFQNITLASLAHSTSSDQVLSAARQNITLGQLGPGLLTDQILDVNRQNIILNQPDPIVNPTPNEAKSSRLIIETSIRI